MTRPDAMDIPTDDSQTEIVDPQPKTAKPPVVINESNETASRKVSRKALDMERQVVTAPVLDTSIQGPNNPRKPT